MFRKQNLLLIITITCLLIITLTIKYTETYRLLTTLDKNTDDVNYYKCIPLHTENESLDDIINYKLITWSYKNAKNYIPLIDIQSIVAETKKYEISLMLLSVIKEESGFDRYAKSTAGAKGLGQIRTSIWLEELVGAGVWFDEIDVYDYRKNIAAINYVLTKYYTKTSSWQKALLKYVNGDSKYVLRVLANFAELTLLTSEKVRKEPDAENTKISAGFRQKK